VLLLAPLQATPPQASKHNASALIRSYPAVLPAGQVVLQDLLKCSVLHASSLCAVFRLQVYRAPAGKISPKMAEMRADLGSGECVITLLSHLLLERAVQHFKHATCMLNSNHWFVLL
jgi:hypothetical protein